MEATEKRRLGLSKVTAIALLVVIVALISVVSAALFTPLLFPRKPLIGVIEINGYIGPESSDQMVKMISHAKTNETIKAVVLKIDSPGGEVSSVQEVYMSLLRLKEAKPIVAWIMEGPSGAYYVAVSASYIYATPGSWIGNIGVIVEWPYDKMPPNETLIETGPFKRTGISKMGIIRQLNMLLEEFIEAVTTHRTQLKLDRTELSKALFYTGSEAAQYGLIDALGSSIDAIDKAANLANITDYEVEVLNERFEAASEQGFTGIEDFDTLPRFYYLYMPQPQRGTITTYNSTFVPSSERSVDEEVDVVLIDLSHNNKIDREDLNILLAEIVSRNHTVRYLTYPHTLSAKLENASSFVVISPAASFTEDEAGTLHNFTKNGGKLLLIQDPTRGEPSNINSLSAEFGVVFANGYLYNLEENDGNYRFIFVDDFEEANVTEGLERLVFYTAEHIYSSGNEIAYTSNSTFSSASHIEKVYSPMVLASNDRVLAIGDQTFLTEPYCYTSDNYKLVSNIADFLTAK
ncbi:MAG: S49 family peptidase [Candidatus Bathyarchaeia archaeon]